MKCFFFFYKRRSTLKTGPEAVCEFLIFFPQYQHIRLPAKQHISNEETLSITTKSLSRQRWAHCLAASLHSVISLHSLLRRAQCFLVGSDEVRALTPKLLPLHVLYFHNNLIHVSRIAEILSWSYFIPIKIKTAIFNKLIWFPINTQSKFTLKFLIHLFLSPPAEGRREIMFLHVFSFVCIKGAEPEGWQVLLLSPE